MCLWNTYCEFVFLEMQQWIGRSTWASCNSPFAAARDEYKINVDWSLFPWLPSLCFFYNPGHHLTLVFSLVHFNSKHYLTWSLQFFDNRKHNLTFISPFRLYNQHIISQERRCDKVGARSHCKARPERHKVIHHKLFKNFATLPLLLYFASFCNFDIVIFSTKHCQQEVVTICSLRPVSNIFL